MLSTPEILSTLIGFKTVSRDANAELIRFTAQNLEAMGGRVRIFPGKVDGKQNLLASFGPDSGDGIILSGHSDVVPVDGQDWSSDPFRLAERNGHLYARGAVDMKGFIASAIYTASTQGNLRRPLHIAISHDEEIGCVGVRSMLTSLAAEGFKASGCIVGEPTGLRVAVGQKGKVDGCICCRGEAAHSANPALGTNAIYLAAGMVREIQQLQDWLKQNGAHDAAYAVPYSTLHVGTIKGGSVLNIVPDNCEMKFEIRFLPDDVPALLLEMLRAASAKLVEPYIAAGRFAAIEITEENSYPGLAASLADPFIGMVCDVVEDTVTTKLGFGSEAGLFDQIIGLPTVVCGPGSIDRAHKPDEYITRAELDECDGFLGRIIRQLS